MGLYSRLYRGYIGVIYRGYIRGYMGVMLWLYTDVFFLNSHQMRVSPAK